MLRIINLQTRCLQITAIRRQSSILRKLENESDIDNLFSTPATPTVSTSHAEVDPYILRKLLNLSGLSQSISVQEKQELIVSLNDHLKFVSQLKGATSCGELKRLVEDTKELTFDDIVSEIENSRAELEKGEPEESWNPLSLTSQHQDSYFVVNEGLIKQDKQ
ncbi:hypothetical protein KL918_001890 [Ogataea parapolymorpha]|uniref:Glu-AdT subunit F n=1 Tax=Ogataea parapolymorpha (strain ATCC 26012 / BCRC 20466 / JCM 22074 / NRRL Y-7560 / DL-1) TaxID=871575 RepID=W1QDU3_OGAPD|nr:hypothetical protein HPODL_04331 [Ogataea parapolymorpha DL-1]ESW98719.1 hypothetical protein HPODL_04331 [Ogataea parapolymorpha DL-1]KAG7868232.1 hypothetical protein KL918_001890 [Ogataea parapolymorpha]KAG7874148.1 hypothetical protein KL916_001488 [Ogataea parapolymorpha]